AARGRELHRIREHVEHDLLQAQGVDAQERQLSGQRSLQRHAAVDGTLLYEAERGVDDLAERDYLLAQLEAHDRDFRKIEDVADEREEMLARGVDVEAIAGVARIDRPHQLVANDL